MKLVQALRRSALERPDDPAFHFLANGEDETAVWSFGELDARARAIAALLRPLGAGGRVLLVFPPGLDFLAGFLGCLYAGGVAVPVYPPQSGRHLPRLGRILADARPAAILTTAALRQRLGTFAPELPALATLPCWAVDEVDAALAADWRPQDLAAHDLALLQYTSGSTATPKGVMVSHGNLLHNEEMIRRAFGQSSESVVVSWLPPYHDMGLIGSLLQSLFVGARCVLMSPVAFLQKPLRWLSAISRYRGTTSGGPNFAYELCLRRTEEAERADLDLSCWSVAFNGAEPVRADTLARFAAAFAGSGFRPASFFPCYGLAEATLFVAGGAAGSAPREIAVDPAELALNRVVELPGGQRQVSCGHAWNGQRVSIVDPETGRESAPGRVGEIRVEGPSVALGYWNRPDSAESEVFSGGSPRALRTGDLGFLAGGELYVTGRLKDLIILRGRNLYPQDVELTAGRAHPDLLPGGGAAFAVETGTEERLVIVHEVARHPRDAAATIAGAVRQAVAEEHEAQAWEVVLIRQGGLPRTSSGKVQRGLCRELYLRDELPVVGRSALAAVDPAREIAVPTPEALAALAPESRREHLIAYLRERAAAALGVPVAAVAAVAAGVPLTTLGLDSLASVELKAELEATFGAAIPLAELAGGAGLEALVERILGGAGEDEGIIPRLVPLSPVERRSRLPLTVGQRALWFLERLHPDSAAYVIAGAGRLAAGADPELLHRALQALVDRHPALRTTFAEGADGPGQQVADGVAVAFRRESAAGWSAAELRERLRAEAFRPFDLERGPLFRATLFAAESPTESSAAGGDVLVLAIHHLIADLWSLGVLAHELGTIHDALADGATPESALSPLELEPADYVRWQERALAAGWAERHWGYWRQRLAGAPFLDLPTDRPRPALPGQRGLSRSLRLDAVTTDALRALARRGGGTLFTTLLTGYQALLARYSGQDEFLVASPTAGRSAAPGARLSGLVGYFVNPVVLRADLTGEPTADEALARGRRIALDAFEHQDFPYPWLAERLQAGAERSAPLVRAALALQKASSPGLEALAAFALGEGGARLRLGGLTLESVALESPATQFEVSLLAAELDGRLVLALQLDADVYDGATAERMLGHLGGLLRAIAATPESRLAELDILSGSEREQLLAWRRGLKTWSAPGTVHGLFEEQARRRPEALALVAGEQRLSYGELARRSGSLASALRRLGVGPEVRVGLAAERSPELVIGILGILRAGGALVPLDPTHPPERLALLRDDSGLSVVVAQGELAGGPPVLLLQDVAEDAWSETEVPASALAYVIYTSGSTGRPKGVGVSHANALPMLLWSRSTFGLGEGTRVLQSLSYAFDFGLWEILTTVASGATLHIPPVAETGDPQAFARRVVAEGIDTVHTTPSFFRAVAETGARLEGLRTLHLGGEALSRSLVERLATAVGAGCTLYNGYGPTEVTVNSLLFAIGRPGHLYGGERTPIGRPSADNAVHVVDRRGGAVPVGVAGELQVGGPGVARGYLGRAELTAETFVPDGFGGEPGGRVYRTGDRVRWRPDGTVEFLGRLDEQVKIRGFRIEPGEVEAALRRHPGVREAVVVARELAGGMALVAYVVSEMESDELRDFLSGHLPAALIPSAFVRLAELPLTPTGKVDRRALPEPQLAERSGERELPRTPAEAVLAGIFEEVLGIAGVGRTDSFFQLGGHSLIATRVVSRLRDALGVELPLRSLFETPTVAALAQRLAETEGALLPPVERVERGGELPLSYAQERLWFLDQLEPGNPAYNLPGAARLRGRLQPAALAAALSEVVRRHEALRTRFVARAQVVAAATGVTLPQVDLRELPVDIQEVEARRLRRDDAVRPFDLGQGPLLRAGLLRLGEEEWIFLLTQHHIASDGGSVAVLIGELSALYSALIAGRPSPLPEPALQYGDYAVWQRRTLEPALSGELSWWREHLRGAAEVLELPTDHPRPAVASPLGGRERLAIAPELWNGLERLGREVGTTPFMTLLAAFSALLSRYADQEELLVGSPVAGRTRRELEGMIGLFVNTLPLRVSVEGEPSFQELLGRVRETTLTALAHQALPFERLVEELAPERSLDRNPLFQVLLAVQERPPVPRLAGLDAESLEPEGTTAKLDLSLEMTPEEEGFGGWIEYRRDLFERATMQRFAGHFEALLRAVAADAGMAVSALPLLTRAEREQMLGWHRGLKTWSVPGTVHGLFEEQARRRPEALALVAGEQRLTYGELERRSGSLASALRRLRVGPEVRVGLAAERSPELVIGILGILRAGGALVPLDPTHPPERLALLRDDSGLSVIVAQGGLAAKLAGGPPVVELDTVQESDWSEAEVPASALAYVIYTSGSTGRPKGVGVSHANAVPMLLWSRSTFGLDEGTRVLQSLSYAFDFGLWEILTTVASGATLHIPPMAETGDPHAFARRVIAEGIDTVHTTPSFFRAVAETGARLEGLRTLHLGGEALSGSLVERLASAVGEGCTLYNGYGPTEVTVNSLLFAIGRPGHLYDGERTPIGHPSADNAVYVVDRRGGAVPVGVAGELQVGGPGVARGYLGRAELTAERFVPDAFGGEPGGRVYRTGDRVRWRPDGSVEFLGRVDEQVKIRGFRIEPGEVEAALRRHPEVREAVVVARELAGSMALVAYVVSEAEEGELRELLRGQLPAALIPSAFARLGELPLTPTGKVDRRALPEPQLSERSGERELPRTPAEAVLAGIFEEVLGIAGVGRTDSFFQLGGHSLIAARVVSRLRDALGVELPLRALFETPTVAALAQRLTESEGALLPPVERVGRGGELPLSYAQERLWFLDQLEPGNPAYNLPGAARLRGRLQPAALAAALSEVVRRHEALRTRFVARAQVVEAAVGVPLPEVDLRDLPANAREVEARHLRRQEAMRPFDLGQGPLLRAGVLRLGEEDWIFLLTQHHIASDGGSVGVLIGELSALYSALIAGRPSPLPEPALQYGDYAVWQRRTLEPALSGELSWWREHLRGAAEVLELPTDHPRPAVASPAGGRERLEVTPELWSGLERLGRAAGTTPFMTLLAAFSALLSRYADQAELLVGSPVAGRTRRELEGMIGLFVNTLPLRVSVEGEPSFRELLGRVRETTLTALAHQALPFERLVEELAPERSLDRNPLFQVLLAVQERPPAPKLAGLGAESLEPEGTTAKLDLSLEMAPEGEGFGGWIEYRRDLFERATMQRFAGHFEALLRAVAADAGMAVSALPLLTRAEQEQMLGWHRGPGTWSTPGTVHGLFEEQARRRPEALALVAGERRLTYGELERRSGSLASALRRLRVGPEVRVGLAAERSPELVIGILGILRAGGALVPLDPTHPPERLALLRDDSDLSVIVAQGGLAAKLAGGPPVVELDTVQESDWSEAEVPASALAYVIYTSGSTGRPKGVGVSHANAVPMLLWSRSTFSLGEGTRVLQSLSYAFDFGLWEILTTVASGATLHIPPVAETGDPHAFARRVIAEGIDTVHTTPSFFRAVAETGARLEGLRTLHLGGEALSGSLVERLATAVGEGCTLYNGYGPTEVTVNSLLFAIGRPGHLYGGERTPIGRPSADNAVYVVDRRGGAVPVGVAGELQVGGPGVARGYLGRAELTAERFVPDGFGGEPGARVYRTGDRVRWRPDGTVEFLGRVDDQVKIRGFRIEPGEVEAALRRHPGVREAVVVARELAGSMALVAYVVSEVVSEVEANELRDFLSGHLPAALIPSAFVRLAELPLTPTGKVDRRALPEPRPSAPSEAARPRGPVEELLAGIYAEVLGLERAGVEESFFELGGHSLLATQVVARVQGLGFWVTVRDLFETPSVAAFAARLIAAGRGDEEPARPLRRVPRTGDLPLSSAQERLWFLDQLDPGSGAYNLPTALRLTGPLHLPALAAALAGLVSRHEALRTRFESRGGRPVQVLSRESRVFPRLIDLAALPRPARLREVERLAAEESVRPFDLARGPLLRTLVVREDDGRHVALFTMHHIVSDGWSMEVLVRELGALYRSALAGTPSALPELSHQYADFAVWQREHLASRAEVDLAYWCEALAGLRPLDLPTDRPRPREIGSQGGGHAFHLPAALSDTLAKRARKEGVTSFMILLASLTAQLSRYTGREDVAVGSPVANRTRAETEGLIGFFVNTLVLRTNCAGDPSARELMGRVREACLGAFAHQDVPFDRVVEELAPDRDPSRTPLFQVVLAVQPAGWRALQLAGLEWTSLPVAERTAKFDLTVTLAEGPDGISGHWGFRRDLFEAATAARMAGHFEVLLAALLADLLANPGGRLSELPLLREAERAQVLVDWRGRPSDYPRERTLDELFAAAAARRPDAVALSWDGGEMTYGELDRRSDLLARRLVARGTGPDARVGLLLRRSPELIVATVAILKAGGAYLPLDAAHPRERRDLMLRDAGAALVVTDRESAPALAGAEGLSLLLVDELLMDESDEPPVAAAPRRPWPESLAYVMYTSGSTGAPKGVAVTHRAVARLVMGNDYARFAADEVFLQLAPFAFDAATFEVWGALLHGARLALAPPEVPTPEELAALLARQGVTTLWLTAGLFHQVVEMRPEALRPLRQLLAGGDVLSADHARRALSANPGLRLIDGYGPTESTTFACSHSMAEPREVGITVPLGRPIANTWAFVLDAGSRPVPIGVPGELFLGGDGLARGYLGRPGLTAERFVPSPYGAAGERLYRTGDRVRWLPSGELDFLGRLDAQVKIRGHRIEPGEVESVLARHPALSGAAVVVREDERGERRLAAFVTLREGAEIQGAEIEAAELRDFLRERLPEPLIPASFHALAALPLTAHGKVDRRALAALRPAEAVSRSEPARGPVAELLAGAWAEVLGVERVGGDDDFFELGGHSLLATRLMSRVRQLFGVELPLRALFEAPTPAALAARLEPALRRETIAGPPPLQPRSRDRALPASFAQERLWLLSELARGNAFYNLPAAVRLRGGLDAVALGRALREIERRHESLRTTFTAQGGKPVQVVAPAAEWLLSRVDLSRLDAGRETEMLRIAREEAERPFDLARDRMLRAVLVRLGADDHVLLITLHHIAADAWSVDVLGRELDALYGAFAAGLASPLAELPVQYADFAVWQRGWLRGERLQALLAHWTRTLNGFERLQLPLDRARPARSAHRGRSLSLSLAREDSAALLALARREGVTLYMLLLSALSVLLASYSGQEDVTVGTPIANRAQIETEGMIGFFVNLLVMRCEVAGRERFRDLLARAREISLDAYAHQELPFERLVEELRAGAQAPLVEVTFSVQNAAAVKLALAGLASQSLDLELTRSRFDLAIDAWERPDGLELAWTYSTEVFDRSTIARMAENFRTLLSGLAAGCDLPVRELPLIAAGELAQLRADGGAPLPASPPEWAHERFAAWAARSPERPAVELGERRWTYGEIEAAANRLASRLASLGAGPERVVGLCVERSPEMVIGVLGILKSGAAYLPLDPESPAERLFTLLEDAGAPWVLTRAELAERFAGAPARLVPFEEDAAEVAAIVAATAPLPRVDPPLEVTAESLAYVIYTSGSTGRPKGVAVSHGSLAAFLRWAAEELLAVSARRLPVVTRLSFDANLLQWLAPLMRGGSVWLVPEADLRDAAALSRLLTGGGEVGFNGVPTLWSAVLSEIEKGRPEVDFGHLYLGGEGVSQELLARTRAALPGVAIWNLYGPTEATSNATCGRLDGAAGPVTVGRAITGARVSVLDADLRPVPWGAVGEICIGGLGLARGYLGRPELTAEAFPPDPWSGGAGERLFRTGDLGRHRAGGIEVLGRRDRQVKIRGHRIELGEIEASLRRHPAVEEAVVTARGSAAADRHLAAYLVLAPEAAGKLAAEAAAERLAAWQESYDDLYDQAQWLEGPEADYAGWIDRSTGRPFPADEMAEWVDAAVERIAALRPERVLDIGCGTGLLLFRLAPACQLYRASDLARNALLFLRERFALLDRPLSQVALRQGAADDFSSYGEERFDTVILNSVVQCFPSVDYLLAVLAGAVRHVSPGGAIFVGDVRSLPLLETLHPSEELLQRVRRDVELDEELALDPAFFQALPSRLPEITAVDVRPRRGRQGTEMTAFRYDVVLHVGGAEPRTEAGGRDWRREGLPVAELHRWAAYASQPLRGRIARRLVPELRAALRASLPDVMVPSTFTLLDALPLNANGKLDRRALPVPAPPEASVGYVAPRNPTETALVEIWRDLLDLERVGIHDNFFELGGHSLLVTQVVSRVREQFLVDLPLAVVFETSTVAELAVAVVQRQAEEMDPEALAALLAEVGA